MTGMHEYRVLLHIQIDAQGQLHYQNGSAIIIERSREGIVHIWPLLPIFQNDLPEAISAQSKSLHPDSYLVDGDWAVKEPWMYFNSLDEVTEQMNRQRMPITYRDLGWHPSIRSVRAMLDIARMVN